MPPRKLRVVPANERGLRSVQRMIHGTIKGRLESASPVPTSRGKAGGAAAGMIASIVPQVPWQATIADESGVVRLTTGLPGRIPWYPLFNGRIGVALAGLRAPAVGTTIVDILKNGVTIFTDPTHRIQIGSGANYNLASGIDVPDFVVGDSFIADVVQVGAGDPGADLIVELGGLPILGDPTAVGVVPTVSPIDIPGLIVWLKADAITPQADNTELVSWADSSGRHNDFTEAGAGTTVKYHDGAHGLNGLPCVSFGEAQKFMYGPNISGQGTMSTGATLILVWRIPSAATHYFIFQDGNDFRDGYWSNNPDGYFTPFRTARLSHYPTNMPQNAGAHRLTLKSGAAQYQAWLDGVDKGNQAASYMCGTRPTINEVMTFSGSGFPGDLFELLIWDHPLTETDRINVEAYLTAKWGL